MSTKIEGTQATLEDVLKEEGGQQSEDPAKREDVQEIRNYRRSLALGKASIRDRPFNLQLLGELHQLLLDSARGRDKQPGIIRKDQNWIGPSPHIEDAAFVPPVPGLLPKFLENWKDYYLSDQPDLLVQLAIVHAQFEILHPFKDGNGRLGRILIPLVLHEKRILSRPMFYMSAYLEKHRESYILSLREIGRDSRSWVRWIQFFLTAVEAQAKANAITVQEILDLYERSKAEILTLTRSQFAIPLLDQLFHRPIFQVPQLNLGDSQPSNIQLYKMVGMLRDAGILTTVREASGRSAAIYAFAELINLCEGKQIIPGRSPKS